MLDISINSMAGAAMQDTTTNSLAGCKSTGCLLLFDNVNTRNIIDFIKEIHFYVWL